MCSPNQIKNKPAQMEAVIHRKKKPFKPATDNTTQASTLNPGLNPQHQEQFFCWQAPSRVREYYALLLQSPTTQSIAILNTSTAVFADSRRSKQRFCKILLIVTTIFDGLRGSKWDRQPFTYVNHNSKRKCEKGGTSENQHVFLMFFVVRVFEKTV